MKRRHFLIFVSILTLLIMQSCTHDRLNDPLMGLELGSERRIWDDKLKQLETLGQLTEKANENEFRGRLIKGRDTIAVEVIINHDDYLDTKLLSVKINLKDDTIISPGEVNQTDTTIVTNARRYYSRGRGDINYKKVEKVKEWLVSRYGTPSEVKVYRDSTTSIRKVNDTWKSVSEIARDSAALAYKWLLGSFDIIYYIDMPDQNGMSYWAGLHERDFLLHVPESGISDFNEGQAYVLFLDKNYKQLVSQEREAFRKTLKPNDLIRTSFINTPQFEDLNAFRRRIKVTLPDINRYHNEETRGVTDVKFKINFKNKFNEPLASIDNCVMQLPQPLKAGKGFLFMGEAKTYYLDYAPSSPEGQRYEYLRSHLNSIKVELDVIKLVFEDGSVLE